jgi:hypothetical protein
MPNRTLLGRSFVCKPARAPSRNFARPRTAERSSPLSVWAVRSLLSFLTPLSAATFMRASGTWVQASENTYGVQP